MIHIDSVKELVKSPSNGRGGSCLFYNLNNGWGVKLYHSEETRDKTFWIQKYCHNNGLAPECMHTFSVTLDEPMRFPYHYQDNEIVYGYLTEVVPVLHNMENCPIESWEELDKAYDKYLHLGFYDNDSGFLNAGWWNDKVVAIDFGCFYLTSRAKEFLGLSYGEDCIFDKEWFDEMKNFPKFLLTEPKECATIE